MAELFALWLLFGGAISIAVMIIIWLPDPPPDAMSKFFVFLIAGAVAAAIGGYVVYALGAQSDPMPAHVAAGCASLIVSGGLSLLGQTRSATSL